MSSCSWTCPGGSSPIALLLPSRLALPSSLNLWLLSDSQESERDLGFLNLYEGNIGGSVQAGGLDPSHRFLYTSLEVISRILSESTRLVVSKLGFSLVKTNFAKSWKWNLEVGSPRMGHRSLLWLLLPPRVEVQIMSRGQSPQELSRLCQRSLSREKRGLIVPGGQKVLDQIRRVIPF